VPVRRAAQCLAPFFLLTEELDQSPDVFIQRGRRILVLVVAGKEPLLAQLLRLAHDRRLGVRIGRTCPFGPVGPDTHPAFHPHHPEQTPGDL
jgi:hypothetical protein